jgi:hypothetical protein
VKTANKGCALKGFWFFGMSDFLIGIFAPLRKTGLWGAEEAGFDGVLHMKTSE